MPDLSIFLLAFGTWLAIIGAVYGFAWLRDEQRTQQHRRKRDERLKR